MEAKNARALEKAKKLASIEQTQKEIQQLRAEKEGEKTDEQDCESHYEDIQKEILQEAQENAKLSTEAIKMRKYVEDLQSNIVQSPSSYEESLQKAIEQRKQQIETRHTMEERIVGKMPDIQKIESYFEMVLHEHAKVPEFTECFKTRNEMKRTVDESKKKVLEMKSIIEQEAMMYSQKDDEVCTADLKRVEDEREKSCDTIRNEYTVKLNEKKVLQKKIQDSMNRQQEILSETDRIHASSKQREDEHQEFVKECQKTYDEEMRKELLMREKCRNRTL